MGSLTSVSILGSTGSIGTQALDVISRTPDRFVVHALAAHSDVETIVEQVERFRPNRVGMVDPEAASRVRERCADVEVLDGPRALTELASDATAGLVLNAVMGAAGLEATLASLDEGITVALANKESCIAGGPLVRKRLLEGATLLPVDSEHAAVHMCLVGEEMSGVADLVITASGGPFRGRSREELEDVTVEDALRHPTWAMGPKITIDSATLMNKGLEVLEANVLFGLDFDAIDVVCHPQSVIHCLVGFADGSWKASLAPPDMRVPIAYALSFPDRVAWGSERVQWSEMKDLTFEPVDRDTFRCVDLAYTAGRTGGTAPAVLNAANEVAVQAFLDRKLGFLRIAELVEKALDAGDGAEIGYGDDSVDLADVLRADAWARERTTALIAE